MQYRTKQELPGLPVGTVLTKPEDSPYFWNESRECWFSLETITERSDTFELVTE